jgi:deoxyribonuclease V
VDPVAPDLVPDPDGDREAWLSLQREVARRATFADDLPFAPADVGGGPDAGTDAAQRTLADADGGEGGDAGGDAAGNGASEGADDGGVGDPPLVAGVDQAFLSDPDRAVSAIVVSRGGTVVERVHAVTPLSIPYVPGLLSFREGGPILEAFAALSATPDLAVFDGSGRIHYRQAGLATHMGVALDLPSVGVAKNLLCGTPRESVDGRPEGWRTSVEADDDVEPVRTDEGWPVVGAAYQSRQFDSGVVNPLYVSPGHRVSAATTVDLVARLCDGYKLPEPTRLADRYAGEAKAEYA